MRDTLDQKIYLKRKSSRNRGLGFDLSRVEIEQKLAEAGITADDWGRKRGQYVLGRYNDEGDYTLDNCRFITVEENHKEKKPSEKQREAAHKTITNVNRNRNFFGVGNPQYGKIGDKSACYGKIWISKLEVRQTRRVNQVDLQHYLEAGWTKGRTYWRSTP